MTEQNIKIAEAYYNAMNRKDFAEVGSYLHKNVKFIGPLSELDGKDAVLAAASGFLVLLKGITIRSKFGSKDQAMLVYDMECLPPIGTFRAATLMTFEDGLISRLELFYDARPFVTKKDEIFGSK